MTFHGNQHTAPKYTYQDIVDAAETLGDELGRPPTTSEFDDDDRFPSLGTIYQHSDDGWLGVLRDAGLEETQVRGYGPKKKPRMCNDLVGASIIVETPYLTHRQYDNLGVYPTSVVKEYFGSWSEACDAAGVQAGKKHGTVCEGPNGERLESHHEKRVAVALSEHDIEYIPHPSISNTDWVADFYLPKIDLWVEVDGYVAGTRPNASGFAAKVEHLETTGEDFLIVDSDEELLAALKSEAESFSW